MTRRSYQWMAAKVAELENHIAFMREHPPQEAAERIAELTGARDQAMEEVAALREHYGHAQIEIQRLNDELKAAETNVVAMQEEIEGLEKEVAGLATSPQSSDEVPYLRSLVDRLVDKT